MNWGCRMEIRDGYKKTKVGWIPEDWEVVKIEKIVKKLKSGLSRRLSMQDIGLPVLRSNNITGIGINFDNIKYWYVDDPQGANTSDYFLQDNDILINFINSVSQIGKACIFHNSIHRNTIYTTNILKIILVDTVDVNFIFNLTKTTRYKHFINSITKPAVNQASFTTKDFKKFPIPLPPLPEQQKIASILTTVDDKISSIEEQIQKTEQLKKGLMAKLLTEGIGHTEFKDTKIGRMPKSWEIKKFEQVLILQRGYDLPVKNRTQGKYNLVASNGVIDTHNEYKEKGPGIITGRSGTIGKVHYMGA